jgi:hypothetical protein
MPRLSLWKPTKGNDFKFMDNRVREMFVIGGTGINIHKYLGPINQGDTKKADQPLYENQSVSNIQDLLFMENRDRKYEKDVSFMKGIYNVQDIDFDLSQFGLFLQNDTIFITFHLNDMVDILGRKLISGDVIELPHLKDDYALEDGETDKVYESLKRYYVIQDGSRASEGFSQTWYPHLWRVKCTPLVDAQEYRDIIGDITAGVDGTDDTLKSLLSDYSKNLEINDAIVQQAEAMAPYVQDVVDGRSGYDTTRFWIAPSEEDGSILLVTADEGEVTTDAEKESADVFYGMPVEKIDHYLSGDGIPPNGAPVLTLTSFPATPVKGEYVLRVDYMPNRLYIFNGKKWVYVEDNVRMQITNYTDRYTYKTKNFNDKTSITLADGTKLDSRQSLSNVLRAREDEE